MCELCGKGVKSKQALQFHMNSHSGLKQFSCHICSLSFTSRSSMASHIRRHVITFPISVLTSSSQFYSIDWRTTVPVQTVRENIYLQFGKKQSSSARSCNLEETRLSTLWKGIQGASGSQSSSFYSRKERNQLLEDYWINLVCTISP